MPGTWKPIALLCAVVAGLAALASGAGVFLRGDLATVAVTTPRGEQIDMLTGGTYRWNAVTVASEGVGWDFVTLFLVVPAFVLLLPALSRGSLRAAMAAVGLLAYFLYQYFEYAVYLAYGPLFLLYVATFALSLTSLALIVGRLPIVALPARMSTRFPRRAVVGFGVFMALLLAGMWLPLIAQTWTGEVRGELHGATTLVVQAFDLGLLVPLGLFTAVTAYRRLPVGYLLACVVVVKGIAMATAIVAMLAFESVATGELMVVPMAVFALTAAACLAIGARVFGSIDAADGARPMAPAAAVTAGA